MVMLAVVFAIAFATFGLASAISTQLVQVIGQRAADPEEDPFDLTIAGTHVEVSNILQSLFALVLVVAVLFGAWRVSRRSIQRCSECQSTVPREATVCRYCTSDLDSPERAS